MSAVASRLAKLEQTHAPKVFFRFLVIRGGKVSPEDEARILVHHGVVVGKTDLVLTEQYGEDVDPPVAVDEPLSLTIIPSHQCIEDALAQLDEETTDRAQQ